MLSAPGCLLSPVAQAVSAVLNTGATLAFHALTPDPSTYEMLGVQTGTGDLTATHTSTIYAKDHEDVYRGFGANEPVWEGGRVVENLARYSEDFSNAAWSVYRAQKVGVNAGVGPNGEDAYEFLFDSAVSAYNHNITQSNSLPSDFGSKTFITRLLIRVKPGGGSQTIRLMAGSLDANDASSGSDAITVTESWQSITDSIDASGHNAPSNSFGLLVSSVTGSWSLEIVSWQIEDASGRTDTTTPSEYIATTSAPVTKVFANANGNSVTSNVVTEGVGAAFAEAPWLKYQPAATNSLLYSRDLTNQPPWSNGGTTESYDEVGLTGEANTASVISDVDAGGYSTLAQYPTVPDDSNTHVLKVWVKKDSDETRFPEFQLRLTVGTAQSRYEQLNTKTGAIVTRSSTGTTSAEVIDDGDFWVLCISVANNSSGNTSAGVFIYPAITTTMGSINAAATGSVIIGNVELHLNKTIAQVRGLGPIFTEGTAVSTDAPEYIWSADNHDDSCAYYMEFGDEWETVAVSGFGTSQYPVYQKRNGNFASRFDVVNGTFRLNAAALGVGTFYNYRPSKLGLLSHVGDGLAGFKMASPSRSPTWIGDEVAGYTEWDNHVTATTLGALNVATPVAARIRNLQRYDIPDYQTGKDKIDELIA